MKKINNHGFSLMEVMIGAGLASGLALIMMQLMSDGNKQKNILESKYELVSIHSEIVELLKTTDNCSESLKNRNPINTVAGTLTKLSLKNNTGAFIDKYPLNTLLAGKVKILSYALSDASSEVDVAGENTTHLLVEYGINKAAPQVKKIKVYVALVGGNIDKCNAAAPINPAVGMSPGGKCLTKSFPFHRAVGLGAVAGTASLPSASATTQPPIALSWRDMNVYCPSKFPLAISAVTSAACSRTDSDAAYISSASGYAGGISCKMVFLEDSGQINIADQITNCNLLVVSYNVGACSITCCDL